MNEPRTDPRHGRCVRRGRGVVCLGIDDPRFDASGARGGSSGIGQSTALTVEQVREAVQNDQVGAFIAVGMPDSELIDSLLRSPELRVLRCDRPLSPVALLHPSPRAQLLREGLGSRLGQDV